MLPDGYHEYAGGGFDVQVTRVDDKVTLSFYRDGELLMQSTMNRAAAMGIVQKILGVLN
jgi:hypothetical protein